jgi:predicted HAD superfamily phosphohydrolase YqeG
MINEDIRIAIFSNMKAGTRYMPFIETVKAGTGREIPIITSRYPKPDPRGFLESSEKLQLSQKDQVVMIGDNFVTDGGCIRAGIPFIKVDPVPTDESIFKKLTRSPQTASRKFYSLVSNIYDAILARDVLKDEDLRFLQFLNE